MSRPIAILYGGLGGIMALYLLYRSVQVGITYDEAWTLKIFVPADWGHLLRYDPANANHHLLNTLLIKALFVLGPDQTWVARLPNVLAGLLYGYAAYQLTRRYLVQPLGWCAFALLLFNPFLLDFFSLARGYGLSLGFLMASLYAVLRYAEERQLKQAAWALVWGALGVTSNFSLLNYWLVLFFVINLVPAKSKFPLNGILLLSLGIGLGLFGLIITPILKLKAQNLLYYGGNEDFYTNTLTSLAKYMVYEPNVTPAIEWGLLVVTVLWGLVVLGSFFYDRKLVAPKTVLLTLTFGAVAVVIAQHYLIGTLYLIDRTALFFYPLLVLSLAFALQDWPQPFRRGVAGALVVAAALNMLWKGNLYKTALWYFDAHTFALLNWVEERGRTENRVIPLDYSWPFSSTVEHYYRQGDYPHVALVKDWRNRNDYNPEAEVYFYLGHSLEKVGYDAPSQPILQAPKDTVEQWPKEHVVLYVLK